VCMCEVIETADGLGIVTKCVRFVIVCMLLCVSTFSICGNNVSHKKVVEDDIVEGA